MIAAFDVSYADDGSALAAAVLFETFQDARPCRVYRKKFADMADYVSGSFYLRELPCILGLLAEIEERIEVIIIDGYVSLGDQPGLGEHLHRSIAPSIAVIGVAKGSFAGSRPVKVVRGASRRPLYVTSHGLEAEQAGRLIQSMHGKYRLPTLLKTVDKLSREKLPRE